MFASCSGATTNKTIAHLSRNLLMADFKKREMNMATPKNKPPGLSPDSPEAMAALAADYTCRIMQLEKELNTFTLLENPGEIRALCCKIIVLKNILRVSDTRYKTKEKLF